MHLLDVFPTTSLPWHTEGRSIVDADGETVASVPYAVDASSMARFGINARLMAAAPLLLSAVCRYLDQHKADDEPDLYRQMVDAAAQATHTQCLNPRRLPLPCPVCGESQLDYNLTCNRVRCAACHRDSGDEHRSFVRLAPVNLPAPPFSAPAGSPPSS